MPSAWLCNAFGVVYGGAIALLADTAMSLAVGQHRSRGDGVQPS